ncbi:hypothetical protein AAC387_Pa05g2587 [Persea americana]|eukprot:TRINITY_DN21922_c0_g2_i1.p2 TRINITY_DN21922_c0_g2~~TRINITY_DN21922_c0_g2_i1.p2  ORF type:complete len:148 (+),score=22.46 TRINITY_DN21922_c0_g2_i1:159-602(+)
MASMAAVSIPQFVPISTSLPVTSPNTRFVPLQLAPPNFRPRKDAVKRRLTVVSAAGGSNGQDKAPNEIGSGTSKVGGDVKRDGRLRWRDLLDPDPENIFSIGLTGLLTWASVQVLWQLFFISLAILVAAIKYSFIAALLLFILITLL